MFRSVIAAVVTVILVVPALAQEGAVAQKKFDVGVEAGYVFLAKPDNEILKDGIGFGGFFGYNLTQNVQVQLPLLYSKHDGKDLLSGMKNELSIMSVTPGLQFHSNGKLQGFMFLGLGATYVNQKATLGLYEAKDNELGIGTKFGAGLNFKITDAMSVGINGALYTSTIKAERLNMISDWETTPFYTAMGQFAYSF